MYRKVEKIEDLLNQIENSLENVNQTQMVAAQSLKVDNINLAEGATITINMTNVLFGAIGIVNKAKEILDDIKSVFPKRDELGLVSAMDNYKDNLILDAIEQAEGNKTKAAINLGVQRTLVTMHVKRRHPELLKFRRAT